MCGNRSTRVKMAVAIGVILSIVGAIVLCICLSSSSGDNILANSAVNDTIKSKSTTNNALGSNPSTTLIQGSYNFLSFYVI